MKQLAPKCEAHTLWRQGVSDTHDRIVNPIPVFIKNGNPSFTPTLAEMRTELVDYHPGEYITAREIRNSDKSLFLNTS